MTEELSELKSRLQTLLAVCDDLRARVSALEAEQETGRDSDQIISGGERYEPPAENGGALEVLPDSVLASEYAAADQFKSVDWRRAGTGGIPEAAQVHDFDETLSASRTVELKFVEDSDSGDTLLCLCDPDDNATPGTTWQIPLRNADTDGNREIKWAAFGGSVDVSVETDTDQSPGDPPGESVEWYEDTGGTIKALQIRGFQDDAATTINDLESTGSGTEAANAEFLFRDTTDRKRVEYVAPADTPFWLRAGDSSVNYGSSIKIGDSSNGYITISAST